MLYEKLARPVLFRIGRGDAEKAHHSTLTMLEHVSDNRIIRQSMIKANQVYAPVTVAGVKFPNPIGLAAGMDKNGVAIGAWPALGFGFAEVGTVTWHPQPGNPQPRLFRLPGSQALINRMGFNNDGAQALAARLAISPPVNCPIGVSIGKSKITPLEEATSDYLESMRVLYRFADYFAVNVSSPNTPGLRSLQGAEQMRELLGALRAESESLAAGRPERPIFVKIAPDLTEPAIAELLEVCQDTGVTGVIATNTTLGRDGVLQQEESIAAEPGGLSGAPLRSISRAVVEFVHRETDGKMPIIGSGGVMSPDHAQSLFDAGASLVQLYSGLVYSGPSLVRRSARRAKRARRHRRAQPRR
ncbi:quinone-dependent dihydroorotate dehydrogenase [Natronoglycomyces albus]|uniref:Dihydroorotate dehydrogenase (quinone) n=1 Tax=Natronoglycomyces albus TaxID=2811108 RepID=A0A895XVR0_9ACTN|nr:quinone-dependent dihydroorotate dehydrogenase [Natronoglycomyces albus]QSB06616.1 quinone-dependent dihydroorotate dehydrogenase [Natronoglycomyces albus]